MRFHEMKDKYSHPSLLSNLFPFSNQANGIDVCKCTFGLLATFCADKLNRGHFSWQDRKDKLCLGWIFTAHQPPRQRGGGRGGLVSTSWQIMQPFMAFSLNRHCQRGRQHKLCDDDRRRKKAGRVSFCLDPHVKMRFAGWGADMWKVVTVEAGMITL